MKLKDNVSDRLCIVEKYIDRLADKFEDFVCEAQKVKGAISPLKLTSVEISPDRKSFTVSFATVAVKFQWFVYLLNGQDIPLGQVVCTLERPIFNEKNMTLDVILYDVNGNTDVEVLDGGQPHKLDNSAVEIVLSCIHLALQQTATIDA